MQGKGKVYLAAKLYVHLCELRSLVLRILRTGRTAVPNDLQFMVLISARSPSLCKFAPQCVVLQAHTASSKSKKQRKPNLDEARLEITIRLLISVLLACFSCSQRQKKKQVQNKLVRGCSAFRKKKCASRCALVQVHLCTRAHVGGTGSGIEGI